MTAQLFSGTTSHASTNQENSPVLDDSKPWITSPAVPLHTTQKYYAGSLPDAMAPDRVSSIIPAAISEWAKMARDLIVRKSHKPL